MNMTEQALKAFETETHLLLGIKTCAACGSALEGCTARCFECLDADFVGDERGGRDRVTTEDWLELAQRQVFYRQLSRLGPANPAARPRVLRFSSKGQLILELPAWE